MSLLKNWFYKNHLRNVFNTIFKFYLKKFVSPSFKIIFSALLKNVGLDLNFLLFLLKSIKQNTFK